MKTLPQTTASHDRPPQQPLEDMAVRLGQQLLVWLWTLPLIAKCLRGRTSECDKAGLNAGLDINHGEEPEPGAHRIVVFKPILRVGSTGVWT